MQTYTIKPGYLVSLKTRLTGGVRYSTTDLGTERDGVRVDTKWETTKHVDDVRELESASDARNKASALIRGACIHTPFGLLCPMADALLLEDRIERARGVVAGHNETARFTRVDVFVLRGRIAGDDAEAVRAIFSDLQGAIDGMRAGIAELSVEKIRESAQRARNLGRMLDAQQAERVNAAVDQARKAARELVRQVEAGSEPLPGMIESVKFDALDSSRFAFLDLGGESESKSADGDAQASPAVPSRELDLVA